ncbi:MAG: hypothetical protein AAB355_02710 [Patescibacteria group bacterium]
MAWWKIWKSKLSGFWSTIILACKKAKETPVAEKSKTSRFWLVVGITYGVLFALEAVLWLGGHFVEVFGEKWNRGEVLFLAQVLYTFASFRTVKPTELGAILLFNRPVAEVRSGLVFVPLFICQLQKETALVMQKELPADPEHIFREEDKKEVPKGFFPPIRIPFGHPSKKLPKGLPTDFLPAEEDDPLNVRVTAETVIIIRIRIKKGRYITFLTRVGSMVEAIRQIQDTAVAMALREFAQVTPAIVLRNLQYYNQMLKKEIQRLVGEMVGESDVEEGNDWGLTIHDAQIKLINFHRDLNTAIGKVPIATLEAKATVIGGDAERQKRELHGRGDAAAELAVLTNRADGLAKIKGSLEVSAEAVIGTEAARAITLNPGQKTIIAGSGGFADLLGIGTSLGESLKQQPDGGSTGRKS